MVTVNAALIREQGVAFAVVAAKQHVQHDSNLREQLRSSFSRSLGGVPVVVMTQGTGGRPTFNGRRDLVRFLAQRPVSALPWRRFQLS